MSSQAAFIVVWTLFFQSADFIGDGYFIFKLVGEYQSYPNVNDTSRAATGNSYCKTSKFFEDNRTIAPETFINYSFNILAFCVVVIFSFFIIPPVIALAIPPERKLNDEHAGDDDGGFLGLEVQVIESKLRRVIRYGLLFLSVFIHDMPLAALGTSAFAKIVASEGKRCFTCATECSSTSVNVTGWSSELVFPKENDYFWLIFIGGKIMGTLGAVALVLFLEQQYRYQLYILKIQSREQLLRQHFGPSKSFSQRKFVCVWISSFCVSLIVMLVSLLMMIGPALTVVRLNMDEALLITDLQSPIEYICYIAWSFWGISLIVVLVSVYYLGLIKPLGRPLCCRGFIA